MARQETLVRHVHTFVIFLSLMNAEKELASMLFPGKTSAHRGSIVLYFI